MFKVVIAFGLIVASAADDDFSHSELFRYAELNVNQTNETITESTVNPVTDSLQTKQQNPPDPHDQRPGPRNEPLIWFWKWSLTNNSCAPSAGRPGKPAYSEDLTMSVTVSVQRKRDDNQEKMVEVQTSHPREKRAGRIPENNLKMNLLDDWMENKVKVSHISHIYIGESMYPYMYEESRVIQSEASKPSSGEDSRLKEVKVSETRHKKEEEVPVYEITKIYEIK